MDIVRQNEPIHIIVENMTRIKRIFLFLIYFSVYIVTGLYWKASHLEEKIVLV